MTDADPRPRAALDPARVVLAGWRRPGVDAGSYDPMARPFAGWWLQGGALGSPSFAGMRGKLGASEPPPFRAADYGELVRRPELFGDSPAPWASEMGFELSEGGEPLELGLRGLGLGRCLADLGIGLLLGPSLHLARPGSRGALHSFGPTPELVTRAFGAFAEGLHGAGVLVAAGSFPGADPDTEAPLPSASPGPHLEAFAGALSRGLEAVSVSGRPFDAGREIRSGGDREGPACCSAAVVRDGLRDGLGFGGLAIAELAEPDHAPKALAAGCDLLAVRRAEQVMPALEALEREVAGSAELAEQAARAAGRVLAARTAWLG